MQQIDPIRQGVPIVDQVGGPTPDFARKLNGLADNARIDAEALEGKQDADPDLDALAGLEDVGIVVRIGAASFAARSLDEGDLINITNPAGTAGNPLLAVDLTALDERVRDTVGATLTDSPTIDFTYDDAADTITAVVKPGSIGPTELEATAVTPGSYTNASLTVDSDGRVTAAASGATGGYRPLVNGDNPPVFIINDDHDLIMGEI